MRSELFGKYEAYVERHRDLLLGAERYIRENPELGFKEWKTSSFLEKEYEKLGYRLKKAGDIPGFTVDIDTGRPGPTLLIFGELDAVVCAEHPDSDPVTGAVHACGHNCQSAALLGVAAALKEEGALDGMSGRIRLCAVPAEELLDLGYREELRRKGVIKYMGGKVEFMHRGLLDGCDLAFMVHTTGGPSRRVFTKKYSNGCISKTVTFTGRAAHAGASPGKGINALYAANLGLGAVNALREKYTDGKYVRIHSIITNGGQMVNAIPSSVTLETQVRAASFDTIKSVGREVSRAYAAGAAAMGAKVTVSDRPGYYPVCNDEALLQFAEETALMCTEPELVKTSRDTGGGCSDMGDIMSVMPAIHPYVSGAAGKGHGADYRIVDPESAVLFSAEYQLVLAHRLLEGGAGAAVRIISESKPEFASKEDYFAAVDSVMTDTDAVEYTEDGAVLRF